MIEGLLPWLGLQPPPVVPLASLAWTEVAYWQLPAAPDPTAPLALQNYLQDLARRGFDLQEQGVWIGSDWEEFASIGSTLPLSAASLTKMVTTLAALQRWGPRERYVTTVETAGEIIGGTLQGDLILRGGGDPLFVWEDAIAIAQALERLGITRVAGDLVVVGPFYLNFAEAEDPVAALEQALSARRWSAEIAAQFEAMDSQLPPPAIEIVGRPRRLSAAATLAGGRTLLAYESLPLVQILQQMNAYSNNAIAERLAVALGGGPAIARVARAATGMPAAEIQSIDGSGLGLENRLSPQAAAKLLPAIARELAGTSLTLADLFPIGGPTAFGTIAERSLPPGVVVKTGSLWRVSALAGAIPTVEWGWVYFAIVNQGTPIVPLREEQDRLLAALTRDWTLAPVSPQLPPARFGDPARVRLASSSQ